MFNSKDSFDNSTDNLSYEDLRVKLGESSPLKVDEEILTSKTNQTFENTNLNPYSMQSNLLSKENKCDRLENKQEYKVKEQTSLKMYRKF